MHLHESRIITHLLKLISDVKDNFIMCVIEKMEKKTRDVPKNFYFVNSIPLVSNYAIN